LKISTTFRIYTIIFVFHAFLHTRSVAALVLLAGSDITVTLSLMCMVYVGDTVTQLM